MLSEQYLDFVVRNQIVLEIKSVDRLAAVHHKQILNYMRLSQEKIGLLLNFNSNLIKHGIDRFVL